MKVIVTYLQNDKYESQMIIENVQSMYMNDALNVMYQDKFDNELDCTIEIPKKKIRSIIVKKGE